MPFSEFPLVVEIRHDSWQRPEALQFAKDRALNLCLLDMPELKGLPRSSSELTGNIAYLRFHGRNKEQWFGSESAAAPYDYLYSREELAHWVKPIEALKKKAETTFVFFNNHLHGQAPRNAEMMLSMLGERRALPVLQDDLFSGGGDR